MSGERDGDGSPSRSMLATLRPKLALRLASIAERDQVAAVLGELAGEEGASELAIVLSAALEDLRSAREPLAGRILGAAVSLVIGSEPLGRRLLEEARERGLADLVHFLESPPPLMLDEVRAARVIQGRDGRPLSLGERKSLARNPGRFEVDRLLRDPAPEVMRNLLSSPRLTEMDVVRIASGRPAEPLVLREVALSRKWVARYRVRLALVSNPYLEPALAVKLAPMLLEQDRRALAADHTLHPRLRECCGRSLRAGAARAREGAICPDSDELDAIGGSPGGDGEGGELIN